MVSFIVSSMLCSSQFVVRSSQFAVRSSQFTDPRVPRYDCGWMGRPTKRFGFELDQCVGRREKAAIAEDAFAVEWVGDGEREELGFEHNARLRALLGGE